MGMVRRSSEKQRDGARVTPNPDATTGNEAELSVTVDALRGSTDGADDEHVLLGMIFLSYICDTFEGLLAAVLANWADPAAENCEEYTAENIFQVPPGALWAHLKAQAHQSTVGLITYAAIHKRGGTIGTLGAGVEGSVVSVDAQRWPGFAGEALREAPGSPRLDEPVSIARFASSGTMTYGYS